MNSQNFKNGDLIDINQTVNGCNTFIIFDVERKDVRYTFDLDRKYEYDVDDLLSIEDIDILHNIYKMIIEVTN